jgi:hypothetical protein
MDHRNANRTKIGFLVDADGNLIETEREVFDASDFLDETRPRGFIDWLQSQTGRDDPIGDLAKDAGMDALATTDAHLVRRAQRGCDGAQRALSAALRQYQTVAVFA